MRRIMIASSLCLVSLSACCTRADAPAEPPPAPKAEAATGVLGASQNGSTVNVKVGETITIELESIPTAGYIWNIAEKPAFLEPAGEGQRPTNPEVQNQPGFTGGNHYLSFRFKAVQPGSAKLVLHEGRPWETDEPPTDTWSITVNAVEAK